MSTRAERGPNGPPRRGESGKDVSIALVVVLLVGVIGAAVGIRHLYLRLDRPGGLTCSMRVVDGTMSGLGPRFLAGYAGPQMREMLWRRIAWPGPGVSFPLTAIRIDRERRPARGERLRIPSSFSILPVELADGVVLELAVPRQRLRRLVTMLDGGRPGRGR
jgi:hypothetical protein